MRRRAKYRLPRSSSRITSLLSWTSLVLMLAGLSWLWWRSGQSHLKIPPLSPSPNIGSKSATIQAETNTHAGVASSRPRSTSSAVQDTSQLRSFPRAIQNVFEAQVALSRAGLSCGSMDGVMGPQTRAALRAFQRQQQLASTGELDAVTKERLHLNSPACRTYQVTAEDLARLQPLSPTWLGKSQQSALEYETILELVAEKAQAHPNLVRRLNPIINWTNVGAGTSIELPEAALPEPNFKAAFVTITLAEKLVAAFDASTNLLAQFPCSIARRVEKRPVGELHVAVVAPNPNYTFDPEIFPESTEARQLKIKLVLPPGPNNPVGVAWIGLDRAGYGIHGTPNPEQVGRTESHGCFRLANWNAEYLAKIVWVGMPVYVLQ